MTRFNDYFYGNKISDYGLENGYVDYRTFAKAFDAVLNNDIMNKTCDIGYWEMVSGFVDNSDEIEELNEQIEELEAKNEDEPDAATDDQIEELQQRIEELEQAQEDYDEVFQWYIIDDNGARICQEFNEIVYYNEELDMYLWGVTHWGTSWDYVLTDIECAKIEK